MSKQVRICSCGRIHFVNQTIINEALDLNKDVLMVCGGCGRATLIGADKEFMDLGEGEEEVFNMYSFDLTSDKEYTFDYTDFEGTNNSKAIHKILYSPGKKVPMKTGMNANSYFANTFYDNWYPDISELQTKSGSELLTYLEQWNMNRQTVNVKFLMSTLTDEEKTLLSGVYIRGFDWPK